MSCFGFLYIFSQNGLDFKKIMIEENQKKIQEDSSDCDDNNESKESIKKPESEHVPSEYASLY